MDAESLKREIGDLLFEQGKLTEKQLEAVRRRQRRMRVSQHAAVVHLSYASEEDTYRALALLHHLDFVDLSEFTFPPGIFDEVPIKTVFNHRVVPLAAQGEGVTLAFCEPPKHAELNNLRLLLGKKVRVALTTPSGLHTVIKKHFGLGAETIQRLREDRGLTDASQEIVFDVKTADEGPAMDASIARYVEEVLSEALRLRATDIHIEPYPSRIKLRYRIDGMMQTVKAPGGLHQLYGAIVSRLKIMAGLNIAEKRLPHDGRISMKTETEEYDLRVSIIPTKHGEAVCLRVLGRQSLLLEFSQLGMEPAQEALIKELVQLPQGLVLITGPTGCGKTTTLYAALAQANDENRKIITIEDPVEYQLEGVVQIQTRDEVGLTFASGLRSVLRHDPDVVLIGEVRDIETAEIAVRTAQTGHLVFSTLHTNDSISAITRLLDMKIDPFLVGSSLVCSIAQRLVPRICRHCLEHDPTLPEAVREEMAFALGLTPREVKAFRGRGTGCLECNQQGFRGQIAIYEFFVLNQEIADLLGPNVRTGQLRAAARRRGWRSLREEGWLKVQAGLVSADEVHRLTRTIEPLESPPSQPT
jgi:general secretion pathway protein E/type IV pilus assembly protein PilB